VNASNEPPDRSPGRGRPPGAPGPRPGRTPFFATCAPGLEPLLHAEVRALGLARHERQVGGVYFEGSLADARRANLWLRTAVRVLMRVARFPCADERALYDGAREVDWARFVEPDGVLVVDAQSSESELGHTRFVEQRVKDAIVDGFRERHGVRPSVERAGADLGVHAHLFRDRCTLSVDTSGEPLHRRGWRREQGRAPLAETLAAAVVLLSGWDGRAPLLDPFCGSGTLLIEAVHRASNTAPGLWRTFGFERWPGHDAAAWEREKDAARAARRPLPQKLVVRGSDRDPALVRAARVNAEAAGVADALVFEPGDALALEPRPGWNAWIVSNLPYGERVGRDDDLDALYQGFGRLLRERCAGYRVALLGPADGRLARLGLAGAREERIVNGGLECRLVVARIDA
jgi:putative N6-adenine-specific DNA methylase